MLVFDFDGVLMNSLDEVALTAYNAATGDLLTSMAEAPNFSMEMFKRNRYHVQQIGDAITLMKWCIGQPQIGSSRTIVLEEYRAIVGGATSSLKDRTNLIYATRKRFINADINRWLVLHSPFQPLWNELVNLSADPFVILTNKNHEATEHLCRHFGLKISSGDIYSGDHGVSKIENMRRIRVRFGKQKFTFLDDSIKNLKDLDDYFNKDERLLSLLLAAWGYTGAGDDGIAAKAGYAVVNQMDVIEILKGSADK